LPPGASAGAGPALLGKVSTLPAELEALCDSVARRASPVSLGWRLVVQATGLGRLRLDGGPVEALVAAFAGLRADLEGRGGALVLLDAPDEARATLDAWGDPGDALPLMRRVKAQFDPAGTLNPGRFVGGI
jgi:glycolate oxidase FAD binding subunit